LAGPVLAAAAAGTCARPDCIGISGGAAGKETIMGLKYWTVATAAAALALLGAARAERFEANRILFQNVTGNIEITTHAGTEIDVAIRQAKTYRPVAVSMKDGLVSIVGEKWKDDDHHDCCNDRIRREFHPRHGRTLSTGPALDEALFADYPTIVVAMPRKGAAQFVDARIKLKMDGLDGPLDLDACFVHGETGPVESAVIGVLSGSRLVVGDVATGAEIDVSGDADVMIGSAASVDVDIAGPGDVILGPIEGMLDVSIAGSGSVRAARLEGPLMTRVAGSGFVEVKAGKVKRLKSIIDGSGAVIVNGTAVQPELRLYGSAEVRLGAVEGRLMHYGSGKVFVGGKLVEKAN
jgi:hypothetical protein